MIKFTERCARHKYIIFAQRTTLQATEGAEQVGTLAAHDVGDAKAAGDCQVSPCSDLTIARFQTAAGTHQHGSIERNFFAVNARGKLRTTERDQGCFLKLKRRSQQRDLQRRLFFRIANRNIRQTMGPFVHRAADHHAKMLIAVSPAILQGRERAGFDHADGHDCVANMR